MTSVPQRTQSLVAAAFKSLHALDFSTRPPGFGHRSVGFGTLHTRSTHSFATMENGSGPAVELKTPEKQQQQNGHSAAPQNGTAAAMPTGAKNPDEMQYLRQCREILIKGTPSTDRTGTGTRSIFGMQARYDLRYGKWPLLTTKRVFVKGVVEELLWFVHGETDAKKLSARGVRIWDANGSRQFLDAHGFMEREEGDLGPVYGFQWRHWGAEYVDQKTDYTGKGIDQLAEVIRQIREEPDSRRIILTAWNPSDLAKMALPPCHAFCQFYVRNGELSCQLYQRSGDMGLGVPFNIASYSLLTHMIAHVTGLKAREFVHTLGDAHVYVNHIEALEEQLKREPNEFPTVRFRGEIRSMDDFTADSIEVVGYNPLPAIKMQMAV